MISFGKTYAEKLNRLIDDNLDDASFSIDTICQALGVSRSHLHRAIKEQSDLSTSLYIRKRRLQKAKHLLLTTNLRISEVGDAVGITNPQNFSTYFIEEFKTSPSEFRKMNAQASSTVPVALETPIYSELLPGISQSAESPLARFPALPRRRVVYAGGSIALLLIFTVSFYWWYHIQPAYRTSLPTDNSLVVLPFTNLGGSDSDPACEQIMEDIHRSVLLIKNLKVIARSSSDQYRNTRKSIWQIGDELQVANVLKGSVLKIKDHIQVKIDIVGAKDDVRLWGHTYSAAYTEIFTLTDQITQDVARQLKLTLNAPATEKLALARTQNLDAYNAVLQGRQLLISRTKADVLAAIARFDRALALDSTYADAHAFKAVAYHLLPAPASGKIDIDTQNRTVEESALKAIRFDPTNSTAYGVLGSLYYSTYQWQASENAFRIALQHNPNDAQASYWYSLLLRSVGRVDEAVHYSSQAITLDPLHPIMLGGHILNCLYANRLDLARAGIKTGRDLFEKSFSYQIAQAHYWMAQADYSRAVLAFRQGLGLNPDDKGQIPIMLYCEAKRGNQSEAIAFLHSLKAVTPRADYERAVVYAGLNQADSSLHYLKKAADRGYLYRDTKVMRTFMPYWSHPVFKAVMHQFKVPD